MKKSGSTIAFRVGAHEGKAIKKAAKKAKKSVSEWVRDILGPHL